MSTTHFSQAVSHLIEVCSTPQVNSQPIDAAMASIQGLMDSATHTERDDALDQLGKACINPDIPRFCQARLVWTCGTIVEKGGNPEICGSNLLAVLADTLEQNLTYLEICQQLSRTMNNAPRDDDGNVNMMECAQGMARAVLPHHPDETTAFLLHQSVFVPAIAVMARSTVIRQAARDCRDLLLDRSERIDHIYGSARSFLTKMLSILDDEPILIMHPQQQKGYQARMSGVPDNFQLHGLLMQEFLPTGKLQAIYNNSPEAYAYTNSQMVGPNAPTFTGAFQLWNWRALLPDGTLPENTQSAQWIWNEGIPADIEQFEGKRVILIGDPPYERTWPAGKIFSGLESKITLGDELSPADVQHWCQRLAQANA